jgi:ribonuclease-3
MFQNQSKICKKMLDFEMLLVYIYYINFNMKQQLEEALKDFQEKIGYYFKDHNLLLESLTHPSCSNKHSGSYCNYQRLEFLGDAILSMILAEILIKRYPKEQEGNLSKRLAHLISGYSVWNVAVDIDIDQVIILSKGEESMGGRQNKRNLENSTEALIAAIYLDSDFDNVTQIISKLWNRLISENISPPKGPVSTLQELTQERYRKLPEYDVIKIGGNDHNPVFKAIVTIQDTPYEAIGTSKKDAQKKSAELALRNIRLLPKSYQK